MVSEVQGEVIAVVWGAMQGGGGAGDVSWEEKGGRIGSSTSG